MAVPHPKTLLALDNFLKSSPLGQYILRRNPVYSIARFFTISFTIAAMIVAVYLQWYLFSKMNQATSGLFLHPSAGPLTLWTVAIISVTLHHYIGQFIQLIIQQALHFAPLITKVWPWLNCGIIKLFHSDAAVDKLNVSLLEYKNLLARVQDYFMQHGGIRPTQTLPQFTQGLLTQLEAGEHYNDLQTLLRLGAFHSDFSITALQYYRKNYLDRIIAPITKQLEDLRTNNNMYHSALPKDILNITSSYVAFNLYPKLANWVLDEMAKPVEAAKTVPVTRLGG